MDLWQFTPLHEAASKNRVEVCSLLLSHGADPTLLNCHSKSSVDMAPTPELKERLTCESCSVVKENPGIVGLTGRVVKAQAVNGVGSISEDGQDRVLFTDERNLCPSSPSACSLVLVHVPPHLCRGRSKRARCCRAAL